MKKIINAIFSETTLKVYFTLFSIFVFSIVVATVIELGL